MTTTVTVRGQTSIPASIRKFYKIGPKTKLAWVDDGHGISVVPIPKDPLKALRGMFKDQNLLKILLEERRKDRERERNK